ncbi:unnamed protein product [Caenorhabditis sp. 36 PRJEB53466]|nr:unnamed protein product [Caenorhabditis sp. 36 PRJEB53466]
MNQYSSESTHLKSPMKLRWPPKCEIGGSLGFIFNLVIFVVACRIKTLSESFAILVSTMAAADGVVCGLFLLYACPMIILNITILKQYSYHCGFALALAYDISITTHVVIVVNRFLAVFTPITYKRVFGIQTTKLIVFVTVSVTVAIIFVFFQIFGCQLYYDQEFWMFFYSDQKICVWYATNLGDRKMFASAVLTMALNLMIIAKVHTARKKLNHGQVSVANKKREMNFLKQTIGQGTYLFVFSIIFLYVSSLTSNKILGFIIGSDIWCSLHTLDGLFVLIYNSEIREVVIGPKDGLSKRASRVTLT